MLLVSISSFSQNKSFTIKQIDSICLKSKKNIEEKFEIEREYKIVIKNKTTKKIKIKSEAVLKIYKISYFDTIKVDTMEIDGPSYSIPEPEIIKATYEYDIIYNKNSVENVFVEFYYSNNKIEYINVKNSYYKGNFNVFLKNPDSDTFKDYDNYFSFCESFKYWVHGLSNKINNIFYERKWK